MTVTTIPARHREKATPQPVDRTAGPWVRPALVVLMLAVVVLTLAQLDLPSLDQVLADVGWGWVIVAALLSAVSFLGSGWNLYGFVSRPVHLRKVVAVQVVAASARIVTPAGVGAHAVNLRLLQKAGVDGAASVGAVAGAQGAQFVASVLLLLAAALVHGQQMPLPAPPDVTTWVVVAVVAAAVMTGLGWALASHREQVDEYLLQLRRAMTIVLTSPRRWLQTLGGRCSCRLRWPARCGPASWPSVSRSIPWMRWS